MIRPIGAALILVALAPAACSSRECATVGCLDGVTINLGSGFAPGQTYALTVSDLSAAMALTIATCTYAPSTAAGVAGMLTCASLRPHMEFPPSILIRQWQPTRIEVKVTSGGAPVTDQTFDVTFASSEPNGSGCGTCTQASVTVTPP
jgi:hypothetical protein